MTMTSEELGAHLEEHGVSTVLLPDADGDDYLAATTCGLTIEVFYTAAGFDHSIVTGPDVNATYDNLAELLRQLSIPTGDTAADEAAAVEQFQQSLPPTPQRVNGRIVGDPVVVGDVWACHSVREHGRTFEIVMVEGGFCYGVVRTNSHEVQRQINLNVQAHRNAAFDQVPEYPYPDVRSMIGAMVKIRLDRMWPTADGYYRKAV